MSKRNENGMPRAEKFFRELFLPMNPNCICVHYNKSKSLYKENSDKVIGKRAVAVYQRHQMPLEFIGQFQMDQVSERRKEYIGICAGRKIKNSAIPDSFLLLISRNPFEAASEKDYSSWTIYAYFTLLRDDAQQYGYTCLPETIVLNSDTDVFDPIVEDILEGKGRLISDVMSQFGNVAPTSTIESAVMMESKAVFVSENDVNCTEETYMFPTGDSLWNCACMLWELLSGYAVDDKVQWKVFKDNLFKMKSLWKTLGENVGPNIASSPDLFEPLKPIFCNTSDQPSDWVDKKNWFKFFCCFWRAFGMTPENSVIAWTEVYNMFVMPNPALCPWMDRKQAQTCMVGKNLPQFAFSMSENHWVDGVFVFSHANSHAQQVYHTLISYHRKGEAYIWKYRQTSDSVVYINLPAHCMNLINIGFYYVVTSEDDPSFCSKTWNTLHDLEMEFKAVHPGATVNDGKTQYKSLLC